LLNLSFIKAIFTSGKSIKAAKKQIKN